MKGSFRSDLALLGDLILYGYRTRYGRSLLGTLWLFLHPLLLLGVYGLVFSGLVGSRPWKVGPGPSFALWLAAGLLPWLALQESLLASSRSFREHAHFLTRLPTTPELFVLQKVLAGTINLSIFALLVSAAASWGDGFLARRLALLPLAVILQTAFALGLGLLLAWADLVLADLGHGATHLLSMAFWLTPIVYPPRTLAGRFPELLRWNPLHHLTACHRAILLEGRLPATPDLAWVLASALALLLLAGALLRPVRTEIPDLV